MSESITTSLEWSKKLKDAGWRQMDCQFYWHQRMGKEWELLTIEQSNRARVLRWAQTFIAAPTAEEILRRLPRSRGDYNGLQATTEDANWRVGYWDSPSDMPSKADFSADTLANAAASLYCYLAENKLLSSPQ